MIQVVYSKKPIETNDFLIIDDIDKLIETIEKEKVELLSIPADEDGFDITEYIIYSKANINTIHFYGDIFKKLHLFFYLAKSYEKNNIMNNIVLKHEQIDSILK